MKRNVRNTLGYKIRMWWYWLTFEDVKHGAKIAWEGVVTFLALVGLFAMIFIFPAFFH